MRKKLPLPRPPEPFKEPQHNPHREPGDRTCRLCGGTGHGEWRLETLNDDCWACNGSGKGLLCETCNEVMPMCKCMREYSAHNRSVNETATTTVHTTHIRRLE